MTVAIAYPQHPFTGLIALGSFVLIFSLCGIAGACCAVRCATVTCSHMHMNMRAGIQGFWPYGRVIAKRRPLRMVTSVVCME